MVSAASRFTLSRVSLANFSASSRAAWADASWRRQSSTLSWRRAQASASLARSSALACSSSASCASSSSSVRRAWPRTAWRRTAWRRGSRSAKVPASSGGAETSALVEAPKAPCLGLAAAPDGVSVLGGALGAPCPSSTAASGAARGLARAPSSPPASGALWGLAWAPASSPASGARWGLGALSPPAPVAVGSRGASSLCSAEAPAIRTGVEQEGINMAGFRWRLESRAFDPTPDPSPTSGRGEYPVYFRYR